MEFVSGYSSSRETTRPAWWFVFNNNRLLIKLNGDGNSGPSIPFLERIEDLSIHPIRRHFLGLLDGAPCYAVRVAETSAAPDGMSYSGIRQLFGQMPETLVGLAGRANHIARWDEAHQFCGRCAGAMEDKPDERAKSCPACGLINYPRISPAIIVAVVRDGRLLLARAARFPTSFYSVLAGFVEPGESLEACVMREVKEEVGIDVKDIRYFGSQPWPFPDSLMVGFTAAYAGGDLVLDDKEILDANWYPPDDLPQVPGKFSIAGRLIEWFLEGH